MKMKMFKGLSGTLILTDTGVIIKRRGFLTLRSEKTIPYNSIIAIQLKKATSFTSGYLKLTLKGGPEAKGWFQAITDENTIMFLENKEFAEAKRLIEEKISSISAFRGSNLDELEKLVELKKKGTISEEEFNAKKKQILGL